MVGQRYVSLGDYVTSSDRLVIIQTVDPQRVAFNVPERYAGVVRRGQLGDGLRRSHRGDQGHGWADHVGLVEKVFKRGGKTYIQTIEGNSGDRVRRKTYLATSSVINGYGTMR